MKKGFTLVELLVSLVLVAIVLTSMSAALIKLKDTYDKTNDKTDFDLVSSSITRIIYNDINDNQGVMDVKLINDKEIQIILTNNESRKLVIENFDGFETTCIRNENSSSEDYIGTKRKDKSTLKYIDNTDPNNEKLLYIKTLDYTCNNNERTCKDKVLDEECTSTSGNKFTDIILEYGKGLYRLKRNYDKTATYKVTIQLNNSINNIIIPLVLEPYNDDV